MPRKVRTDHLDANNYGLSLELVPYSIPMSVDGTPLTGQGTIADGTVVVTGPQTVRAANPKRRSITFTHDGGDPVRIGAPGVASNSGAMLVAGRSTTLASSPEAAIGMNLASGTTATISWTEELGP